MKLCCIAVFVAWVLVIFVVFIKPEPVIIKVKECYKQTTDSKTMLHRIRCEVE